MNSARVVDDVPHAAMVVSIKSGRDLVVISRMANVPGNRIPRAESHLRLTPIDDRVSIHMDRTRAPVIRVSLFGGVTDEAFARYLADSDEVIAASKRYVLFYDAVGETTLSADQRKRQVAWIRENEAALRKLCLGAAFHFDSAVTRGALTAILWMARLPFEYVIVSKHHEGLEWAVTRLRDANIAVASEPAMTKARQE